MGGVAARPRPPRPAEDARAGPALTPPPGADARTTPPALRPVAIGALAAVAAYLLACFGVALAEARGEEPPAELARSAWLGRWRMFTDLRTTHQDLLVEVRDPEWRAVDPATLYPSAWDEGPGYTRDDFLDARPRVYALARDVCARTGASEVRLTRVRWPKTPGGREQPRVDEVRDVLVEGTCAR